VIHKITNDYLFGTNMFVSENNLLDFKNKFIYKIYKIQMKDNFNKMDFISSNFSNYMILFKTYNYSSDMLSYRIRSLIFKEFADIDFSKMEQEELEKKISSSLYTKYKEYDEIFTRLNQEIEMRTKNQRPGRNIYIFLPIKLIIKDEKSIQTLNNMIKTYFQNELNFIKGIDKTSLNDYNVFYEKQLSKYKEIRKFINDNFINPSTNITVIKDQEQLKLIENISMFEKEGNCIPTDDEETDGLFNSFFYDSACISGNRYYDIFTLFNEQLKNLKDSDKYYKLMKLVFKFYNIRLKVSNSLLKTFNKNLLLFFLFSTKNIVDKDYSIIKTFDNINEDISVIMKVSEIKKEFILSNIVDKEIAKKTLQIENLQKKEEESLETNRYAVDLLKSEIEHYKTLKTRIGDKREKTFVVSSYIIQNVLNQYRINNLYDEMNINSISIKQLNPDPNEYLEIFDIKRDKAGIITHTTNLLHYLNIYLSLKNSVIVNNSDIDFIKRFSSRYGGEK
jgi:hypothetical protein